MVRKPVLYYHVAFGEGTMNMERGVDDKELRKARTRIGSNKAGRVEKPQTPYNLTASGLPLLRTAM